MEHHESPALKKVLRPAHLWALAVGLVISGEYFGWNYGWAKAGTIGFLIATLLATLLYIGLIFSLTELATAIPDAGGPFAYAESAFGRQGGVVAGYATFVEFVFAPPAIAFALGSYVHFLHDGIPPVLTAVVCYVIFTAINIFGIKESAAFNFIVTVLAIAELLIFIGIVSPHFSLNRFLAHNEPLAAPRIFEAMPYAIWFYLGIEGVAMVAEEVKDPNRNIPKGYIYGMATLVLLALAVMLFSGGIGDWRRLSGIDYPLPESISMVLGQASDWTKLFAGIGLFGLIASFHSLIIGYSRQIFALSRARLLPAFLSKVNRRFSTPHWSLLAGGAIGLVTLFTGTTDKVITVSALGAVLMYAMSMLSLFRLRRSPQYQPAFKTPCYPWFPAIALVLSLVSMGAIIRYNFVLSLIFFAGLGIALIISRAANLKTGQRV